MSPRRAFTLIELLVVVAIIAILASIAVPNFLEAQTRSKVSRIMADMRSVAVAIESYTVDYNAPPYDGEPGFTYSGWATVLRQVTTPVAYISSVIPDTFQDNSITEPTKPNHTHYVDYPANRRHSFDYSTAYWNDVPNDAGVTENWRRNLGISSTWKLSSCGPDLRFVNAGSYFGMAEIYDPTNGTISQGDLVRGSGGIKVPSR